MLEDDHKGFQRIMVEHEAEWRFLRVFHGTFTTALEVIYHSATLPSHLARAQQSPLLSMHCSRQTRSCMLHTPGSEKSARLQLPSASASAWQVTNALA